MFGLSLTLCIELNYMFFEASKSTYEDKIILTTNSSKLI